MVLQVENKDTSNIVLPNPQLRQCVSFYNILTPQANMFSDKYTLIPNAGVTLSIAYDGKKILANVWGASTTSLNLGSEPNHYHSLLLIELLPYGLYQLTGFDQTEFTDKRINLEDVSSLLTKRLCNAFLRANSLSELTQSLDRILLNSIGQHRLSSELVFATKQILATSGILSVKELATCTSYSERHLNRLFHRQIGINIKSFSRLTRLNHTLLKLNSTPCTLADLAVECGFYDQSHFIQDFKTLCGTTPETYLKNMSDFSYTTE